MRTLIGLVFMLALASHSVIAQTPSAQVSASVEAASRSAIVGPADIRLNDRGVMRLTDELVFVPYPEAGSVLEALSGEQSTGVVGLVFPRDVTQPWFVAVQWDDAAAFGLQGPRTEPAQHTQGMGYPALNNAVLAAAPGKVTQLQWLYRLDGAGEKTTNEDGDVTTSSDTFVGSFGLFGLRLMGRPDDARSPMLLNQLQGVSESIRYDRTWSTATMDMARAGYAFIRSYRWPLLLVLGVGFWLFRKRQV